MRTRERARARRGRPRRRLLLWLGAAVALGLVFFIGLALGRALEEAPKPGRSHTQVRTLVPTTVTPVETVTVTVSNP